MPPGDNDNSGGGGYLDIAKGVGWALIPGTGVVDAYGDFKKGNYGSAALNVVLEIPLAKVFKVGKAIKAGIKGGEAAGEAVAKVGKSLDKLSSQAKVKPNSCLGCESLTKAKKKAKKKKGKKPYSDPKNRPKYGDDQVEKVYEAAKDTDGKVYDPNTGELLEWDKSKSRAGQWDMGHVPKKKYSKLHKDYMDGKITKDEFLQEYRDPKNYRPESPSANRSHEYE